MIICADEIVNDLMVCAVLATDQSGNFQEYNFTSIIAINIGCSKKIGTTIPLLLTRIQIFWLVFEGF
jgi:hypothetical protein